MRILLIDDDDMTRGVVRRMLEAAGHEVAEATDGHAGIALYHARPSDVVITDILMPERDGLETIRALRQYDAAVKIIAISGGGHSAAVSDFLDAAQAFGARRVLMKPFSKSELETALVEVLADAHGDSGAGV
jgi:CheY-like chemotaxis protein